MVQAPANAAETLWYRGFIFRAFERAARDPAECEQLHEELKGKIWEIANRLRGPYRPPQYRLVMLPMVVLRRLDCLLEPTKAAVLKQHEKLLATLLHKAKTKLL